MVQKYSDKSQMTMKSSRRCFYSLYLCILTVSDEVRRRLIVGEDIFTAKLPPQFDVETVGNEATHFEENSAPTIPRPEKIKITYDGLHDILSLFIENVPIGFDYVDASGHHLHFHPVICIQSVYFVEGNDLSVFKQGNQTLLFYNRCRIPLKG